MRDFNFPGPMALWPKVAWIAGMEQSLQILQNSFQLIIATSADHSDSYEMISALKRVGAEQYFKHFFSQKELGYKKPHPEFFRKTALLAGFKPEECIMIGNLYDKDIVGAYQAGMKTILFDEADTQNEFPFADQIITDMQLLPQAVDRIQSSVG
jgi:putative hydrolase of the HAD superfamily